MTTILKVGGSDGTLPPEQKKVTFNLNDGQAPVEPGAKTPKEDIKKNVDDLAAKPGCTVGSFANALKKGGIGALRTLAGASGLPLYATATLVGGGLSLAVVAGASVLAVPAFLAGAAVGAAMGASSGNSIQNAKELGTLGAQTMFKGGQVLNIGIAIPQLLVIFTIGKLGSGLTAFALTGKTESQQKEKINKNYSAKTPGQKLTEGKEKSTNSKLENALFNAAELFDTVNRKVNP